MAEEKGLTVDMEGYEKAMEEAREVSRGARSKVHHSAVDHWAAWPLLHTVHCIVSYIILVSHHANCFVGDSLCREQGSKSFCHE